MSYPLYPADPNRDPAEPFRNLDPAPSTRPVATIEARPVDWEAIESGPITAEEIIERQRERFGGVKVGSAFFGWLTATGTAGLLAGLLLGIGAVLGLDFTGQGAFAGFGPLDAEAAGWIGAGTSLAILIVAFYCGGYVAGRMARFSGVVQGIAVWVWAIVIAIVGAILGVVLDSRYDLIPDGLVEVPRVSFSEDVLVVAGIVAAVVVVVATLGGAILGGMAGVRYHRRVDRVGLDV